MTMRLITYGESTYNGMGQQREVGHKSSRGQRTVPTQTTNWSTKQEKQDLQHDINDQETPGQTLGRRKTEIARGWVLGQFLI